MDFGSLAARMAGGLDGVRACLIVSRDGLSLGAHPAAEERRAREAWDAVQSVGDVHRGFAEVGQELWAVARRGPYAAIIVASPEVRPGLLLDRMDTHLLTAERLRARSAEEGPESQAARPEPARRPRTPLHPEPKPEAKADTRPSVAWPGSSRLVDLSGPGPRGTESQVRSEDASELVPPETPAQAPNPRAPAVSSNGPVAGFRALTASAGVVPAAPSIEAPADDQSPENAALTGEGPAGPEGVAPPTPAPVPQTPAEREVDRIALAREFSRLQSDEFGGGK